MWRQQKHIFRGGPNKDQASCFSRGIYLQRYLSRSKRHESMSIFFYYHWQSFFIGLFDKLLEKKKHFLFFSLEISQPGLDSLLSPCEGSRRTPLSQEILLISLWYHFYLGSVSSLKALPLYIRKKTR